MFRAIKYNMKLPFRDPYSPCVGDAIIENKQWEKKYIMLDLNFHKIIDFCGFTDIYIFIIWGGNLTSEEWATAFEQTRALCYSWGKSTALCFFHISKYNSVI